MKHFLWSAVLAMATVCSSAASTAGSPRLNVLFLFADDQRADTIGALGNPLIHTPNLDRLCQQGLAFTRAYMQGGWHGATCVPSRAMLLSGQSLFHIDEQLLRDQTWPEAFGRAGYATFVAGKWHNGTDSLKKCFQLGRGIFLGGMSNNPLDDYVHDLQAGEVSPRRHVREHLCAVAADEAIRFLQEPRSRPFFCYVAFDAPHDPHIVPPDFPLAYDPDKMPLPPNFLPRHPFDNGELKVRDELLLPKRRRPNAVKAMLADYYRYITFLDSQIGRVLNALAALPCASNTLVVFSADSGVARGSHGLIGKQNLYEYDSVRVPLIIAGPGIPSGQRTSSLCYLYDVMPSLGARCGVPAPPRSEGLDLTAVLRQGDSAAGRPALVFAYRDAQRALVTRDWKLIRYPKAKRTQLYYLKDDPYEINNLADKTDCTSTLACLAEQLKAALALAGDNDPRRGSAKPVKKRKPTYEKTVP
jgi:arylsulfatase A-like enzyme